MSRSKDRGHWSYLDSTSPRLLLEPKGCWQFYNHARRGIEEVIASNLAGLVEGDELMDTCSRSTALADAGVDNNVERVIVAT